MQGNHGAPAEGKPPGAIIPAPLRLPASPLPPSCLCRRHRSGRRGVVSSLQTTVICQVGIVQSAGGSVSLCGAGTLTLTSHCVAQRSYRPCTMYGGSGSTAAAGVVTSAHMCPSPPTCPLQARTPHGAQALQGMASSPGSPAMQGALLLALLLLVAAPVLGQDPTDDANLLKEFRDTFANGAEKLPHWTSNNPCDGTWSNSVQCYNGRVVNL